ncbi:MAG: Na+/H+ antiporter subunit C [Rhodobacteraceae bacterium]|nr:Na+/H+ antiporter subunit C [Paracoccaceae bacterium]
MESLTALIVGILVAASVYLMLARNFVRFLFGLILLSNAANLVIFASGRMTPGAPALVPYGADAPLGVVGNALPQALVLTAIVIGFGLLAFTLALAFEAYRRLQTMDTDKMRLAEPEESDEDITK